MRYSYDGHRPSPQQPFKVDELLRKRHDPHPAEFSDSAPNQWGVTPLSARHQLTAESASILCNREIRDLTLLRVLSLVIGSDASPLTPYLDGWVSASAPYWDRKSALVFRSYRASRRLIIRGYWASKGYHRGCVALTKGYPPPPTQHERVLGYFTM